MDPGGRRSLVGGRGRPRVACPTCGLRIPLEAIVILGVHRSLFCQRCHGTEIWEIGRRTA